MQKRIHILATGGTIAGQTDVHGGYAAGQINVEVLLQALPARPQNIEVTFEQLANVGSQSITHDIWYKLANRINTIGREQQADGIVVTHGTDTMEETAYFLNLVTPGHIPVVLTGAMKPADAFTPDGPENLLSAIQVASHSQAKDLGVLVVMNNVIHSARYIQKTGSNQDNAFQSAPLGPVGQQTGLHTRFFVSQLNLLHTGQTAFSTAIQQGSLSLLDHTQLPDVGILYAHGGMTDNMIAHSMGMPHRGIVVAGVGAGNISDTLEKMLARRVEQGVTVVRSSRLAFGNVTRNVEVDDDKYGFIASGNLNAAKSRILLTLALTQNLSVAQIQSLYSTH